MKKKENYLLSIFFTGVITIGCILTLIFNPKEIAGGLYRGWVSSPEGSSVFVKLSNSFSLFEDRFNTYFVGHNAAVNSYGAIQKMMGRTLVDDVDKYYNVLKLNNDYLTFAPIYETGSFDKALEHLCKLDEVCEQNSAEFLYVPMLSKNQDISQFPENYPIKPFDNYEQIIEALHSNNIDSINLKESAKKHGMDLYSLFYRTDHHWKSSSGLFVAGLLTERMNELFDFSLESELLDPDNFTCEHYENVFLGTQGKRVGKYYGGMDDFDVIYPDYSTDFNVEYYNLDEERSGDFQNAFIFRENLDLNNPLTLDTNMYDTYMDGNHALIKCHNKLQNNGKKGLIVIDSYGCVVAPYLALEFSELDCIDVRGFTEMTVEEYIENEKPDVVIYMIYG